MKKNNKKGFTLIELLSVIIVLAVIMVLAIPSVLNATNEAKKKSFVMYAQRALTKAGEYVSLQELTGKKSSIPAGLTAADIGLTDTGSYTLCVSYTNNASTGNTELKIYLADGDQYYFNGAGSTEINDANLKTDGKKVAQVKKSGSTITGCQLANK